MNKQQFKALYSAYRYSTFVEADYDMDEVIEQKQDEFSEFVNAAVAHGTPEKSIRRVMWVIQRTPPRYSRKDARTILQIFQRLPTDRRASAVRQLEVDYPVEVRIVGKVLRRRRLLASEAAYESA